MQRDSNFIFDECRDMTPGHGSDTMQVYDT